MCTEAGADCNPGAWFKVPSDEIPEPQKDADSRSFIYTKLLCPLQKDSPYIFSVYIKTPASRFNHLDIWLTGIPPMQTGKKLVNTQPSLTVTSSNYTSAYDNNWRKYTLKFTASGTAHFLMLGNFSRKVLKEKLENTVNNKEVVYEIDSVELFAVNKQKACAAYEEDIQQLYTIHNRHSAIDFTTTTDKEIVKLKDKVAISHIVKEDTITLPGILFNTNSYEINKIIKSRLDSFILLFNADAVLHINTAGHTDSTGNILTIAFYHKAGPMQ